MDGLTRWQSAFIFSVIFSLFFLQIPPFSLLITGLIVSIYLLCKRCWILSGLLTGFCWFFIHASFAVHWQLPQHLYKKSVQVTGIVSEIPIIQQDSIRFNLELTQFAGIDLPSWQKVQVRINYRLTNKNHVKFGSGDKLQLYVKLKPSHGFANLGGFSYQKWLLSKKIRATGYVDNRFNVIKIHAQKDKRQQLFNHLSLIAQTNKDSSLNYLGLLVALAMGEKQLISNEQWQLIRANGIGHLLAISGLHIGMMFVFARFISLWLFKSIGCCARRFTLNAPSISLYCGLIAAGIYAYLAGFAVSTVRAMIMLTLFALMLTLSRTMNARTVIITCLTFILIDNPLTVLQPSIWLSFVAVITILLLFWWFGFSNAIKQSKIKLYFCSLLLIQLVLFITMLPLSALIFNGVSLSGSWVNLIAVPWVSFITVPITLFSLMVYAIGFDGLWLLNLADSSLELLFRLLQQPFAAKGWQPIHHIPWYSWLLLLFAIILIVLPISYVKRGFGYVLLIPWVIAGLNLNNSATYWQLQVFDVGQGLALAIEKNNQIMLYDLGPRFKSGFNTAEQVVLPYLHHQNFNTVDLLIISHSDSDHAGGYRAFLQHMKVNQLIAPDKILSAAPDLISDKQNCLKGSFSWQGLTIELLSPNQKTKHLSRNDSSCVVMITDGQYKLLLTGDISKRIEKKLIADYGNRLNADILIAPHHGSSSSSSERFIDMVNPQYVIFSSGFLNRYGFPRSNVVSRYQKHQVLPLNTAQTGQITFTFADDLSYKTYRQQVATHWYYNH